VNPAAKTLYDFDPELEEDIDTSLANTKNAEEALSYKWDIQREVDEAALVQTSSDPICGTGGCDQHKHPKKKGHPMNYPVPSFGADPDIAGTHDNLAWAEQSRGHNWDFKFAKPPVNEAAKTMYNYAPELDSDMKSTIKHTGDAEDTLNTKWDYEVQLDQQNGHKHNHHHQHRKPSHHLTQSDPISGSAGWPERKNDRRKREAHYNFNPKLDGDIVDTHENLENTEETLGKKWKWE
jgi:hypothetical protein